jgi:hypothetical protein
MSVTALCALACAFLVSATDDSSPELSSEILAADISAHVQYLASDELKGRAVGTPECVQAAKYLAGIMEQSGLAPGDGESFLQAVPLCNYEHTGDPVLVLTTKSGEELPVAFGQHFTVRVRGEAKDSELLALRIVRSLEELPEKANAKEALLLIASSRERGAWLKARDMGSGQGWGLYMTIGSKRDGKPGGRRPRGRLQRATFGPEDSDFVTFRGTISEQLLADEFTHVQLSYTATREEIIDYNVVARINGVGTKEQPELAKETIVFSAHFDHIGTREAPGDAEDADVVFNGADDDASGTATVLELAAAFAALEEPPVRTLVFLLATGEERGLLGTNYYIDDPVVPLADTVTNLNFEMLGRPDDLVGGKGKLWLTGFERTTLGAAFAERGIDVVEDKRPDQNFYQRSDNMAFVRQGIIGQTLSTYNMHTDYHQVSDEWDTLDYEHMEACAKAAFAASRMLADGSLTPEWLPGGQDLGR